MTNLFSSLSESGFIPTLVLLLKFLNKLNKVLISFREWLHSYNRRRNMKFSPATMVLISFREWLHSYKYYWNKSLEEQYFQFSSLSESGFIPTLIMVNFGFGKDNRFSSLSESGFIPTEFRNILGYVEKSKFSSLSESGFIPTILLVIVDNIGSFMFSSLSESGFIPTWKTFGSFRR